MQSKTCVTFEKFSREGIVFLEKFGIFELLDTLSAIVAPASEADAEQNGEQTETPVGEVIKPRAADAAFSVPEWAAPAPERTEAEKPPEEEAPTRKAIGSFLERHNAISKKIDGKS